MNKVDMRINGQLRGRPFKLSDALGGKGNTYRKTLKGSTVNVIYEPPLATSNGNNVVYFTPYELNRVPEVYIYDASDELGYWVIHELYFYPQPRDINYKAVSIGYIIGGEKIDTNIAWTSNMEWFNNMTFRENWYKTTQVPVTYEVFTNRGRTSVEEFRRLISYQPYQHIKEGLYYLPNEKRYVYI